MGLWDSENSGGGGGGTAVALTTPAVANFAALPAAAAHTDEIYYVQASTGVYLINRKNKGYYKSDGATWTPWEQDDLALDAIAAEATTRATADTTEATTRATADTTETNARIAADAAHDAAYPHALLNTLQAQILRRSLGA